MSDKKVHSPEMQNKIKKLTGLGWMTKGKLDSFSTIKYLLMDIYRKNKKTGVHFLGYDRPEDAPFFVPGSAYRAPTSSSLYNLDLFEVGEKIVEYDFNEAYTVIMKNYYLPSNTYLKFIKYDTEKTLDRIQSHTGKRPYAELKTYSFFWVIFKGTAKKGTYANPKSQSMLADYGENPLFTEPVWLSEIELKILFDFYDIEDFVVVDSHTYKCKQGLLKEYFERIEPLKTDPDTLKLYKNLRTKVFGAIGQKQINAGEAGKFDKYSMYNRAFSSMVAGVFRDRMLRYEQKYVNSPYGLIRIKTDGLYFREEVPEFEHLYELGVVKKKVHSISQEEATRAKEFKEQGMEEKENLSSNANKVGIQFNDGNDEYEFDFG